jgi:hypothetical protein
MGFLQGLLGFLKGDFVKNAMDFVNTRWPPDMSEAQRGQMELVIKEMLHQQAMDLAKVAREDEAAFNQRIVDLEGTAHDLKSIPFVGALIIFLRGAFRPLFAYGTAYIDWVYFTTNTAHWPEQQQTLLIAINLLVLVFFFGERAMKNIMPLITGAIVAKVEK